MHVLLRNFCSKCRSAFLTPILGALPRRKFVRNNSNLTETEIFEENLSVLTQLGFHGARLQYVLKKVQPPNQTSLRRLKLAMDHIQALGYSAKKIKINYPILKLVPSAIDNRFKVLEEGGFFRKRITLAVLKSFHYYTCRSVEDLKVSGFIYKDIAVMKNILWHSDFPRKLYKLTEEDQSQPFEHLQRTAVLKYLCWKCKMEEEVLERKLKILAHPMHSVKLMLENYELLTENVGLAHEQIQNNIYLLFHTAAEYRNTIEQLPTVGPFPIRTIAKLNPKLLMKIPEKLKDKIELIKELGLPLDMLLAYTDILLLSARTIRARVQALSEDPVFRHHLHNPRFIKAVIFYNMMQRRHQLLNDLSWRCQSFDLLSVQPKEFQRRVKSGNDSTKGADLKHYLSKELGMSKQAVKEALKKNSMWHMVPLITVAENLALLRSRGFSDSQTQAAATILLYPNEEVGRCLDELEARPDVDCCRDPLTGRLRPELTLNLALYFLERPNHFNDTGIFTNQPSLNHDLVAALYSHNAADK